MPPDEAANLREDPLLTSARREALIVAGVWFVAMTYTVGYCAIFGYGNGERELRLVFGFPDWVFWGIVTPWVCCVLFGIWFATFYMSDDEVNEGIESEGAVRDEAGEEIARG
jgi:hypothetical protein